MFQNRDAPKTFFFFLTFVAAFILSCQGFKKKEIREGEKLAKKYCSSCHQFPEPALLNKTTWANHVLPRMGNLMGFYRLGTGGYVESGESVQLPLSDWNKLIAYYISESPEALASNKNQPIQTGLKQFSSFVAPTAVAKASTTLVSISDKAGYYFGDGLQNMLYKVNAAGILVDSVATKTGIVHLQSGSTGMMILNMGVLYPSDERKGSLLRIDPVTRKQLVLLDSLQRPVHASYKDLNNDQLQDIVICEFGNKTGKLSWYENLGNDRYRQHILRHLAGAVKTIPGDFNDDGLTDIVALMAQGDEAVFIYYNKGNGSFREERVLQFPPSYGSNSMDVLDFNKDGFADLLITNGDNGDYPPVLKPYHGIRIYLNNGSNKFTEKIFLQMNGAGKALARDFDGDGDPDIASISYFPDFDRNPGEGFIYWENTGNWSFKPYTFEEVTAGRWLTMDAGDVDADGDLDILLGNAYFTVGFIPETFKKRWDKYAPAVILLKNKLH